MNNTAVNTLQYYTPGAYTVVANVATSAFLYGFLTVILLVSIHHLIRRGVTQPSTAFMLGSALVLYVSTAVHFGVAITYSVGYGRLLNEAVAALSSTSSSTVGHTPSVTQFQQRAKTMSYIVSLDLATSMALGDAIVWWRVCVLWPKRSIFALGSVLITCTFTFGILSTVYWPNSLVNVDMSQPLLSYGDIYGGLSGLLSLVTNATATLLIGRKAWEHRQVLRRRPGGAMGRWTTPAMKVLILLVESGIIYTIILVVAFAYNMMSRSRLSLPSTVEFVIVTRMFLTGCFVPLLAIYPTVIIFVAALNRSVIEGSLLNADSPSAIPTHVFPGTVLRSGPSAEHVSSNTACQFSHTECALETLDLEIESTAIDSEVV